MLRVSKMGKLVLILKSYQIRTKHNISSKQATWYHAGLRQTKCSLLIYCWIVKAKAIKAKTIFVFLFFFSIVVSWYSKVNMICYGWCEGELVILMVLETFNHFNIVNTSVKKIKQFLWQRLEILLQRQGNWVSVTSLHFSVIVKAAKLR